MKDTGDFFIIILNTYIKACRKIKLHPHLQLTVTLMGSLSHAKDLKYRNITELIKTHSEARKC